MESLLIGSFPITSPSLSRPLTAELSSVSTGSHVSARSKKNKAWKSPEKLYSLSRVILSDSSPIRRQQNAATRYHAGSIDGSISALNHRSKSKFLVNSAAQPFESEQSKSLWKSLQDALDALYRFSRPYAQIGTVTTIISVALLPITKLSDLSPFFFAGVLKAIIAGVLMNMYIGAINQLSDVDIDKINKPYLPLASGELSLTTGQILTSSFALTSLWLGWITGSWPLFWSLFVFGLLGTGYSVKLPLLRWKGNAATAALSIMAMQALVVPIAFYFHVQSYMFKRPATFPKPLIFAVAIMSLFSVVQAFFKDIPDISGDKLHGVKSLSVRLGQKKVFWICISLLEMGYFASMILGATSSVAWSKYITVLGHALMALVLWLRAKSTDLSNTDEIQSFYMFIWQLFYVEHALIPFVR